ncbi:MAG TPA: hypothetical protein V6C57_17115 [Coleofasciculaceae cyanobacterium]
MTLYFAGAALVFSTVFRAFLKDDSTPKNDVTSWIVIGAATIAWPLVLPSIVRKRLQKEQPLNLDYLN